MRSSMYYREIGVCFPSVHYYGTMEIITHDLFYDIPSLTVKKNYESYAQKLKDLAKENPKKGDEKKG